MRQIQRFGFGLLWVGLVLVIPALAATGCGGKSHGSGHDEPAAAPTVPPPTPDTTPIEALRTPAGLVLKIENPTTPTPSPAPTPSTAK
jgi:hypothetical protein